MSIADQIVACVMVVERICDENRLIPPVKVKAIDLNGKVWEFEFNPEWDSFELLLPPPSLPVTLHITDSAGHTLEENVTDSRQLLWPGL